MRSELNYKHLECFFSLSRNLSFSKTSIELKIAQPAISKQIKMFEEYLGMQLFLRTKQRVQLTSCGRELYDKLFPLYNELELRVDSFLDKTTKLRGKIVFGCLNEVGEKIFVKPLLLFNKKYPSVIIEIKFLKGYEIYEGIKNGQIDIGIIAEKIIKENIRIYEILTENIILVTGAKNNTKQVSNFHECEFVAYRKNDPLIEYYVKKAFPRVKKHKLQEKFIVNSHKSIIEVLKNQPYYAVLPSLSVSEEIKKKTLVNVGPKNLNSNLYLIYRDLEFPDKKTTALSKFLRDYANAKFK